MPYIGNQPFGKTVRTITSETLTSVANTFYPTGGYTVGYVDVYLNGVRLTETADFTATDGSTVTLLFNPLISDTVDIVSYGTVEMANAVRREGDTLIGTLNTRSLVPTANVTYDIGTSDLRYRDLYLSGNTIQLGNVSLSTNGEVFVVANTTGGVLPSELGNTTITGTLTANDTTIVGSANVTGVFTAGNTTITGRANFDSSLWNNTTGGDVHIRNSSTVGAALTLKPTNSASFANGWSLYAGATTAAIGDGSIGFWNHTVGQAQFYVDQVGRLRLPYQPSFFAYHNASDVYYTPNQILPYQNTLHNLGGHYNASTSTFTAPIAGTYLFSATANAAADSNNIDVPRAYWQVNGSNIGFNVHFRGSDSLTEGLDQRSATIILQLSANDTVRIQVQVGRWDLFGANHFCGYLLG